MIDRSREKSSAGLGLISCRWRERGRDISERRKAIVSRDTVPKLIVRPDDLLDKQHYNKNGPEHLATSGQTEQTSRGRLFKVSFSHALMHSKDLSFNHRYYSSETIFPHNRAKNEGLNEEEIDTQSKN